MEFQKTSRDVISNGVLINYQYIDDGNYVAKHFYYPVEDGMMKVFNTHIFDADDNIVEVIRYDEDGNISQELDITCELAADGAYCTLTREQTLAFAKGSVKRQVTVHTIDGTWENNDIGKEKVADTIYEG